MTRKFPFRFGKLVSVLIVAAGILSAVMLAYNIYALSQIRLDINKTLRVIFTVINALLFAAILLILLFSRYRLVRNTIKVSIGFIPVAAIPYSAIAKFVISPKTQEFFIIYKKDSEMKTHLFCLSSGDAAQVMDAVSEIYPDIIREKI